MERDAKQHGTNRRERVWMCEVCEQAPARVTCKADAAALCTTCDHDIHSANPIASRHERIPVAPFYTAVNSSFLDGQASPSLESNSIIIAGYHQETNRGACLAHVEIVGNFLPQKNINNSEIWADIQADVKSIEVLLLEQVNELGSDYDLVHMNEALNVNNDDQINSGADCVVPAILNEINAKQSSSLPVLMDINRLTIILELISARVPSTPAATPTQFNPSPKIGSIPIAIYIPNIYLPGLDAYHETIFS